MSTLNAQNIENIQNIKSSTNHLIEIDESIFKAYDIRGIYPNQLNPQNAYLIAQAIAKVLKTQQQTSIAIGYDGRLSSPALAQALSDGLCSLGIDVYMLGLSTTPMCYAFGFLHASNTSCIMVTGSHNPSQYNGFKIMINQSALYGDGIKNLHQIILSDDSLNSLDAATQTKQGQQYITDLLPIYTKALMNSIKPHRALKIAVDCGNGVPGAFNPAILKQFGHEVVELYSDVDGTFPNHHPDPAQPKNLQDVISAVKTHQCDIGIAFDGDGDRLGLVTPAGHIIYPDMQMMLFAKQALLEAAQLNTSTLTNKIIYDVKCSYLLPEYIAQHGGQPIMWRTGHSYIKAKIKQEQALLGGEMSGHIFFADRWFGFDDALYSALRLTEIISQCSNQHEIEQLFNDLPKSHSTPELHIETEQAHHLIAYIQKQLSLNPSLLKQGELSILDGARIDYRQHSLFGSGFALMRASNTTPILVMRFEADSADALQALQSYWQEQLTIFSNHLNPI